MTELQTPELPASFRVTGPDDTDLADFTEREPSLLHVSATRACGELVILWAGSRVRRCQSWEM